MWNKIGGWASKFLVKRKNISFEKKNFGIKCGSRSYEIWMRKKKRRFFFAINHKFFPSRAYKKNWDGMKRNERTNERTRIDTIVIMWIRWRKKLDAWHLHASRLSMRLHIFEWQLKHQNVQSHSLNLSLSLCVFVIVVYSSSSSTL